MMGRDLMRGMRTSVRRGLASSADWPASLAERSRSSARPARGAWCNSSITAQITEAATARMASVSKFHPAAPAAASSPVRSPRDPHLGQGRNERVSILIVGDDFLAAMEIEAVLKETGFQTAGVAGRAEGAVRALGLGKSATPTIVIMDVRLAGNSDGIDAALDIFHATGIRSIFATAHYDADTRSRAQAATPLGWLPKPYAPHALLALVKKAVEQL